MSFPLVLKSKLQTVYTEEGAALRLQLRLEWRWSLWEGFPAAVEQKGQ